MKKEFKITRKQILKLVHGSSIDNLEKWFPEVFKTISKKDAEKQLGLKIK
jgi:hypothetical protein